MREYKTIKTYEEINDKVKKGLVVVVTAGEILEIAEKSRKTGIENVDVVTTGTFIPPTLPYSASEKLKCRVREGTDTFATSPPLASFTIKDISGMDIFAAIKDKVVIPPGKGQVVPTGIAVALPEGYEAQIRPHSGHTGGRRAKLKVFPVTVYADYRGEITVTMRNDGKRPITIRRGDRIAQMVIYQVM